MYFKELVTSAALVALPGISLQLLFLPLLDPLLNVIILCLYLSVAIEITHVAN